MLTRIDLQAGRRNRRHLGGQGRAVTELAELGLRRWSSRSGRYDATGGW